MQQETTTVGAGRQSGAERTGPRRRRNNRVSNSATGRGRVGGQRTAGGVGGQSTPATWTARRLILDASGPSRNVSDSGRAVALRPAGHRI